MRTVRDSAWQLCGYSHLPATSSKAADAEVFGGIGNEDCNAIHAASGRSAGAAGGRPTVDDRQPAARRLVHLEQFANHPNIAEPQYGSEPVGAATAAAGDTRGFLGQGQSLRAQEV